VILVILEILEMTLDEMTEERTLKGMTFEGMTLNEMTFDEMILDEMIDEISIRGDLEGEAEEMGSDILREDMVSADFALLEEAEMLIDGQASSILDEIPPKSISLQKMSFWRINYFNNLTLASTLISTMIFLWNAVVKVALSQLSIFPIWTWALSLPITLN